MKKLTPTQEIRIARISILVIFLALIRTIAEPLRLEHVTADPLPFSTAKPFLIGGLVAGSGLLLMTFLLFYQKHRLIILTAVTILIALLLIKAFLVQ